MNGTDSESCPVAGYDIGSVETLASAAIVLVS